MFDNRNYVKSLKNLESFILKYVANFAGTNSGVAKTRILMLTIIPLCDQFLSLLYLHGLSPIAYIPSLEPAACRHPHTQE